MTEISEYDKLNYDYSTYWEKRGYENLAEKNILDKIFSKQRGKWFLDIGGSYGRLVSTYAHLYKKPLIIDYSLKTLQRNRTIIKNKYPNIELIAANAYKMPFRDNVFDAGMMIRVLHHIKEPKKYLKEARRVFKNDSIYVQEFPNKIHIKARIKALVKFNLEFFNISPYNQPIGKNLEGSQKEHGGIFLNYHPKHIHKLLISQDFILTKKFGSSFLRSPFIKRLINQEIMFFFEKILQRTLSWTNISPSIMYATKLRKKEEQQKDLDTIESILICPICKGNLNFNSNNSATCQKCSQAFKKEEEVWDFRVK